MTGDAPDLSDVEYPDSAGYPDGVGTLDDPADDAVPSGVDPTVADEPESDSPTADEDDTDLEENDG
ncbi:hypothetical protein [Herbiconiux sp. YIM B11900]|uniref:hypothetical protein n=1 Tax=Herbiconiux sp. YIM B11900 TaxID=3404131 RepID=UPI003F84AD83